jgi:hypothetical protein
MLLVVLLEVVVLSVVWWDGRGYKEWWSGTGALPVPMVRNRAGNVEKVNGAC